MRLNLTGKRAVRSVVEELRQNSLYI